MQRSFYSVAVSMAIIFSGANLVTPLFPIYITQLQLTGFAITSVFAIYAVGVVAALVMVGSLSDRFGQRTILILSLILSIVASTGFATASTVWVLLGSRFIEGLAIGFTSSTANAVLSDLASTGHPRRAATVGGIATMIGFGSGPLTAGVLADTQPLIPRLVFGVLIAACLLALWITWAIPNTGRQARRLRSVYIPKTISSPFTRAATTFGISWVTGPLFLALGPSILNSFLHADAHLVTGLAITVFYASASIGQAVARKTAVIGTLLRANALLATSVLLVAAAEAWNSLPLFIIAISLAGVSQGLALSGGLALITIVSPAYDRGAVITGFFLAGYLPIATVPPLIGLLEDRIGLHGAFTTFSFGIASAATMALIDILLWRRTSAAVILAQ